MGMQAIRVLVVDDHMMVRAGLSQVIGAMEGFAIAGEAENGEEALLLCQRDRPDVVLLDVRMPGMGGRGATEAIRTYHPDVKIIGLSTFDDGDSVARMLEAGASGFLPKAVSAHELADAIRRVHAGEIVVGPGCDAPAPVEAAPAQVEIEITLGGQQRRVLALLTKGYTNAELATYLGVSLSTARYHVSSLLLKLGVTNRTEAAALAVRNGLIDMAEL